MEQNLQNFKIKKFFAEHFLKIFDYKDKDLNVKLITPPKSFFKTKKNLK